MANEVRRSHAIGALVLGILEMVFGLIIIICSFVLGSKLKANAALTPYWAGIPYIIPGILGVVVGITKNFCAVDLNDKIYLISQKERPKMVAFMVLNIICFVIDGVAAILIAIVIGVYATVAAEISSKCSSVGSSCVCNVNGEIKTFNVDGCDTLEAVTALLWAIVIFAALCAIVTLAASIIGCISVCCTPREQQTVIVQQPVVMAPAQGYAQPPGYGQPGAYPVKS